MSEAREQILGTIRRGLGRGELDETKRQTLEARFIDPSPHVIPSRSRLTSHQQIELFISMARESAATVERVNIMDAVPAAILAYLTQETLSRHIVMAPTEALTALPWDRQQGLQVECRRAENGDRISVTLAFAGIAETGTVMLLSGPHSPTTLNFLPDVHIVVLPASRLVGPYEDAWAMLRQQEIMPRTVNLITGPSRSADIEQKHQLGAHGPIRVHIVLVNE